MSETTIKPSAETTRESRKWLYIPLAIMAGVVAFFVLVLLPNFPKTYATPIYESAMYAVPYHTSLTSLTLIDDHSPFHSRPILLGQLSDGTYVYSRIANQDVVTLDSLKADGLDVALVAGDAKQAELAAVRDDIQGMGVFFIGAIVSVVLFMMSFMYLFITKVNRRRDREWAKIEARIKEVDRDLGDMNQHFANR